MLLIDEWLTHLLMRYVEIDADHQATSSHIDDVCRRLLQLLQLGNQVFAHLMGILHEVFRLEHVEHSQRGCTGQMVAAKGGTQLSIDGR